MENRPAKLASPPSSIHPLPTGRKSMTELEIWEKNGSEVPTELT